MNHSHTPVFPAAWQPLVDKASLMLRALALDEAAKERFCSDPALRYYLDRVAQRYVAGSSVGDAVARVRQIAARGHSASAEYMGESCRDESKAEQETSVFLTLIEQLDGLALPCSISFDLSHIGSVIDPELGYRNARRIARSANDNGREVMISMEGADRADQIYAIYRRLHDQDSLLNVGITLPAKLHRSADDLAVLMTYPGRIRLVKGAFLEDDSIAYPRDSPELAARYRQFARTLLAGGQRCSIATHDHLIQQELAAFIRENEIPSTQYEFESLIGLGSEQIDNLRRDGFPTREYAVFGHESFLYVLNRIAEHPIRVYQAIADALAA